MPTTITYKFSLAILLQGVYCKKYQIGEDYNPLYLVGFVFFIIYWLQKKLLVERKFKFLMLALFLSILIVPVAFGISRYVFPYIIILCILAGAGFHLAFRNNFLRRGFILSMVVLLAYYLINTLIILPYGLGWADSNKFLKRNLVKAHATYYDFNGEFTQNIHPDETVVNYGLSELFYANFKYKNLYNFFDQSTGVFEKPQNLNKILIRGGDFGWMCAKVKIKNCDGYEVTLITSDQPSKQYLYYIKRK